MFIIIIIILSNKCLLDVWCAQGEGSYEELPGKRAPNIVSSCASGQPHLPLKRVLSVLLAVHRPRLDVPPALTT